MSKKVALMCFSALMLGVYIGEFSISETNQYCEMVKIYIDSDGHNGWPDYNKNYEEVCGEK